MTTIDCFAVGTLLIALIAPVIIVADAIQGPPLTQSPENPSAAIERDRRMRVFIGLLFGVPGILLIGIALAGLGPC